ncbi:MAG: hypothetical protein LGR52_09110, partial [Candidatus Thiosymbion ectosymbiont of Robbea hypermnestra]|nr:hypothetical protein [Candidatus Thiosymbion ectosymbiont of Robbea hypermnestra]
SRWEASGRRPWPLDSGVPPGMTVRWHRQRQEPAETTEAFFVAWCENTEGGDPPTSVWVCCI